MLGRGNRLRQGVERLKQRWQPRALILVYHRVAELTADPWSLAVTPHHFAEHLAILRSDTSPLTLTELVRARDEHRLPPWPVAVTFDDGYADNTWNAKPLLTREQIPATFYLTSGLVGRSSEFWWDHLERILLTPGTLPERLQLRVNGGLQEWSVKPDTTYTEADAQRYRRWRAWEEPPTQRHLLYRSLWELVNGLPDGARADVLKQLQAWGTVSSEARPSHRTMTEHEVREMAQEPLFEVGAHSLTHSVLATLPRREQEKEIGSCKTHLEHLIGGPIASFAYPYGKRQDYNDDTIRILQERGFSSACVNYSGLVTAATDRFQLPRMYVYDWGSEDFTRHLTAWFRN